MTRRRKPLPQLPCSLMDESGQHDIARMRETRAKGRITYLCPECGFNVTIDDTEEASKEAPSEDPAEARPEAPKKTEASPRKKKEKESGKRPAYRQKTKELRDGATIEAEGHIHTFYRVEIRKPEDKKASNRPKELVFYEIFREDGEWIGRVSQAVSWERTNALIYRFYHPEEERYPQGFTWTGPVRFQGKVGGRIKETAKGSPGTSIHPTNYRVEHDKPTAPKTDPEEEPKKEIRDGRTVYVTIPKMVVERFDVRTDDEVSVTVGDLEPSSPEEYYHVSSSGKTKVIILSKLRKWETKRGLESSIPEEGRYTIVRVIPHIGTGRRDLCLWALVELEEARKEGYRILAPSLSEEQKRKAWGDPKKAPPRSSAEAPSEESEDEPEEASGTTIFNDF